MKLIGLSINGLRKIRAAELDFDGRALVQIKGRNGAGKSTIIDAIKYLLRGSREIPAGVVSHGIADESVIIGRINDYTVRRVIKDDGKSLLSIEKDGNKMGRPQEFLDAISGQFLDPEYFMNLSPAEKRAMVVRMAGLDFSEIDSQITTAEQDRLVKGRALKAIGIPEAVERVDAVSLSDLVKERNKIEAYNATQRDLQAAYGAFVGNLIHRIIKEFDGVTSMDAIGLALGRGMDIYERGKLGTPPMAQPEKSYAEIDERIANAEALNEQARQYEAYLAKVKQRESAEEAYNAAQSTVEHLRGVRDDMMNTAHVPIKGLKITETGLEYKGASCENWSTSESLKISLMLAVAYSGDLRTVYIKRGEAFDRNSLASIKEFAEKHDVQIIMEIVDDSYSDDEDGIIWLEEGQIVKAKKE